MHARGTGGVGLEYACKAKTLKGLVKIRNGTKNMWKVNNRYKMVQLQKPLLKFHKIMK